MHMLHDQGPAKSSTLDALIKPGHVMSGNHNVRRVVLQCRTSIAKKYSMARLPTRLSAGSKEMGWPGTFWVFVLDLPWFIHIVWCCTSLPHIDKASIQLLCPPICVEVVGMQLCTGVRGEAFHTAL